MPRTPATTKPTTPPTTTPPTRARHAVRVAVVVAVSVAGGLGVVGCALGWLLMGFMGTAVEPWEPVAYPAGAVLCVLVPVLVGRRLLGARGASGRWAPALVALTVVVAALAAVAVLGAVA